MVPTMAQIPCAVDQKQEGSSEVVQCLEEDEEEMEEAASLWWRILEGIECAFEGDIHAIGLI